MMQDDAQNIDRDEQERFDRSIFTGTISEERMPDPTCESSLPNCGITRPTSAGMA